MPLKTDTIEEPRLNLTPMIDIVFLLVIFFMVGTRFAEMEHEYEIELPTGSEAQPLTSRPDEIVINVRRNGRIEVNGERRSLAELERDLKAARRNYADQAVIVRADGREPYQHVMDVMAVCDQADIRSISLAYRLNSKDER